ncbi:hypothetical protein Hanom_Chr08g00732701 [Helianthus anomalus]
MWCSIWFWAGVGISLICGLWVGYGDIDGLGTAVTRGLYNTRVVIWSYGLPLLSMFFVISLRWDWGVCVSINSVVLFERWISSTSMVWVLGNGRLGISLFPGDKREHQVFVSRHLFSPSIFIYRTMQRLENHFVGKKPVCVVCSGSTWTRSVGFLGTGFLWVSGGIRVLKALRTILVTSTFMVRGYRFVVLWGCTNLGVIRMEAVTAGRSLDSSSLFFCPFVVHSSDSQTWIVCLLSLYSVLGGVFWGFDCESGDIRGLSSTWVVILLNPLHFRSVYFFHSHLCFCFIGDLSLFCFFFFVASLKGALTIMATFVVMVGGVRFFMLWGCNSPGVIRKQITTVLRTLLSSLYFCLFFIVPCCGNQTWIFWLNRFFLDPFLVFLLTWVGLFDDFGVGWFWILGSKEEVLKYASDEGYVKVDIGWVRRYVKGWVRRLLSGIGTAGYKSFCSFRRGGLVVGQFGPMGRAHIQGKSCLFVLKSGMEIIWKWGMFLEVFGIGLFGTWVWGGGVNFDMKLCWKGRKAGNMGHCCRKVLKEKNVVGRIMEWKIGWSLVVLFSACLVR